MKISEIEIIVVTRTRYENPELFPYPFDMVKEGAMDADEYVNFAARWSHASLEKSGQKLVDTFKINQFPTILFVDVSGEEDIILDRLEGRIQITASHITKKLLALDQLTPDGTGHYLQPDGSYFSIDMGFNLLCKHLGICDLPKWLWAAIGIAAGYKTITSSSTLGKVFFGTTAGYAFVNWRKK